MEYTRINSWFGLGGGLIKAKAMYDEGWELVSVASMSILGSTYCYQLIFKRVSP